jgi:hypothetical protein
MTHFRAIAAASLALCLTAPAIAAEPQVPRLDVTPTCRPIDKTDMIQFDEKRCRQIENSAREQLVRQWTDFPAANRALCIQTATMGGTASYVELITCLELKREVARGPADQAMKTAPAGLNKK